MVVDKLNDLREDMKTITQQIISLINKRMEIAKQIGHIKNELNLDVVDGKVEQDIKNYILKYSNNNGLDPEFSCRILNLLINESVIIQNKEKKNKLSLDNITKNDVHPITKSSSSNYNSSTEIIKIRTHMDVFNKAKQLESMGKNIIHLEVGEPDFAPPIQVKEALSSIYDKYQFHYTETAGIFELRKKICINLENLVENTSSNMLPENLITTVGGRFAIFCAFFAMLRPGDEIIVIEPAWPAYKDCADHMGVKTVIIRTSLEENWDPAIDKIERSININTKLICLNYPNNPTGKILDEEKLKSIIQLAEKNNIYIISDEVYCNYAFKKFTSVLKFPYKNSIMVGSFSKTFAMTGFRVGFAYSLNRELIKKISKIQSLSLTSVAEPMQYCALAALSSNPIEYVNIIKKRIDIACNKLTKMPLKFNYPDGAMYIFAKINPDLLIDDLSLTEKLLENGVAVAPGSGFGSRYTNFIRLSTCIEEDKLENGLEIINQTISR